MKLVVDANPIISLLITPGKPVDLLYAEGLELIAPQLLFDEITNNKEEIIIKSKLNSLEIERFIAILRNRITIIPEKTFLSFIEQASIICPDKKDTIYFALALHQNCGIWSNEKQLKEQNQIRIYATHELIQQLIK